MSNMSSAVGSIKALLGMPIARLDVDMPFFGASAASSSSDNVAPNVLWNYAHPSVYPSADIPAQTFGTAFSAIPTAVHAGSAQPTNPLAHAQKFTPGALRGRSISRPKSASGMSARKRSLGLSGPLAEWYSAANAKEVTFAEKTAVWHKGLRSSSADNTSEKRELSEATRDKINIENQLATIKAKVAAKRKTTANDAAKRARKQQPLPPEQIISILRPVTADNHAHDAVIGHCHGSTVPQPPQPSEADRAAETRKGLIAKLLQTREQQIRVSPRPETSSAAANDAMAAHLLSGAWTREAVGMSQQRRALAVHDTATIDDDDSNMNVLPLLWVKKLKSAAIHETLSTRLLSVHTEIQRMRHHLQQLRHKGIHTIRHAIVMAVESAQKNYNTIRQKVLDIQAEIAALEDALGGGSDGSAAVHKDDDETLYRFALLNDLLIRWKQKLLLSYLYYTSRKRKAQQICIEKWQASIQHTTLYCTLLELHAHSLMHRTMQTVADVFYSQHNRNAARAGILRWRKSVGRQRKQHVKEQFALHFYAKSLCERVFRRWKAFRMLSKAGTHYNRAVQPYTQTTRTAKAFFALRCYTRKSAALRRALLLRGGVEDVCVCNMQEQKATDLYTQLPDLHTYLHSKRIRAAVNIAAVQHIQRSRTQQAHALAAIIMPIITDRGCRAILPTIIAQICKGMHITSAPLPLPNKWFHSYAMPSSAEDADDAQSQQQHIITPKQLCLRISSARVGYQVLAHELWKYAPQPVWQRNSVFHQQAAVLPATESWLNRLGLHSDATTTNTITASAGIAMSSNNSVWEPIPRYSRPVWISLPRLADAKHERAMKISHVKAWIQVKKWSAATRQLQNTAAKRCLRQAWRALVVCTEQRRVNVMRAQQFNVLCCVRSAWCRWRSVILAVERARRVAQATIMEGRLKAALRRWHTQAIVVGRSNVIAAAVANEFRDRRRLLRCIRAWAKRLRISKRERAFRSCIEQRSAWRLIIQLWPEWVKIAKRQQLIRKVITRAVDIRKQQLQAKEHQNIWNFHALKACVAHWQHSSRQMRESRNEKVSQHTADAFWRTRRLANVTTTWLSRTRLHVAYRRVATAQMSRISHRCLQVWKARAMTQRQVLHTFRRLMVTRRAFNTWLMYVAITRRFKAHLAKRCLTRWADYTLRPHSLLQWRNQSRLVAKRRILSAWSAAANKQKFLQANISTFSRHLQRKKLQSALHAWRTEYQIARRHKHNLPQVDSASLHAGLAVRQVLQGMETPRETVLPLRMPLQPPPQTRPEEEERHVISAVRAAAADLSVDLSRQEEAMLYAPSILRLTRANTAIRALIRDDSRGTLIRDDSHGNSFKAAAYSDVAAGYGTQV